MLHLLTQIYLGKYLSSSLDYNRLAKLITVFQDLSDIFSTVRFAHSIGNELYNEAAEHTQYIGVIKAQVKWLFHNHEKSCHSYEYFRDYEELDLMLINWNEPKPCISSELQMSLYCTEIDPDYKAAHGIIFQCYQAIRTNQIDRILYFKFLLNLGNSYATMGDFFNSIQMYLKLLELSLLLTDVGIEWLLAALSKLAQLSLRTGAENESDEYISQFEAMIVPTNYSHVTYLCSAYLRLASIYSNQNEEQRATHFNHKVIEMMNQINQANHQLVAAANIHLGDMRCKLFEYKIGNTHYLLALEIYKIIYQDKIQPADIEFTHCKEFFHECKGTIDASATPFIYEDRILSVYEKILKCYEAQHAHTESHKVHLIYLHLRCGHYGSCSAEAARSFHEIGEFYSHIGHFRHAIESYSQAQLIYLSLNTISEYVKSSLQKHVTMAQMGNYASAVESNLALEQFIVDSVKDNPILLDSMIKLMVESQQIIQKKHNQNLALITKSDLNEMESTSIHNTSASNDFSNSNLNSYSLKSNESTTKKSPFELFLESLPKESIQATSIHSFVYESIQHTHGLRFGGKLTFRYSKLGKYCSGLCILNKSNNPLIHSYFHCDECDYNLCLSEAANELQLMNSNDLPCYIFLHCHALSLVNIAHRTSGIGWTCDYCSQPFDSTVLSFICRSHLQRTCVDCVAKYSETSRSASLCIFKHWMDAQESKFILNEIPEVTKKCLKYTYELVNNPETVPLLQRNPSIAPLLYFYMFSCFLQRYSYLLSQKYDKHNFLAYINRNYKVFHTRLLGNRYVIESIIGREHISGDDKILGLDELTCDSFILSLLAEFMGHFWTSNTTNQIFLQIQDHFPSEQLYVLLLPVEKLANYAIKLMETILDSEQIISKQLDELPIPIIKNNVSFHPHPIGMYYPDAADAKWKCFGNCGRRSLTGIHFRCMTCKLNHSFCCDCVLLDMESGNSGQPRNFASSFAGCKYVLKSHAIFDSNDHVMRYELISCVACEKTFVGAGWTCVYHFQSLCVDCMSRFQNVVFPQVELIPYERIESKEARTDCHEQQSTLIIECPFNCGKIILFEISDTSSLSEHIYSCPIMEMGPSEYKIEEIEKPTDAQKDNFAEFSEARSACVTCTISSIQCPLSCGSDITIRSIFSEDPTIIIRNHLQQCRNMSWNTLNNSNFTIINENNQVIEEASKKLANPLYSDWERKVGLQSVLLSKVELVKEFQSCAGNNIRAIPILIETQLKPLLEIVNSIDVSKLQFNDLETFAYVLSTILYRCINLVCVIFHRSDTLQDGRSREYDRLFPISFRPFPMDVYLRCCRLIALDFQFSDNFTVVAFPKPLSHKDATNNIDVTWDQVCTHVFYLLTCIERQRIHIAPLGCADVNDMDMNTFSIHDYLIIFSGMFDTSICPPSEHFLAYIEPAKYYNFILSLLTELMKLIPSDLSNDPPT